MLLVNLNQNKSKDNMYFSETLLDTLQKNISQKKKSIVYINKRGEFSALICNSCQFLYKCHHCDVSLNIHSSPEKMICHLCSQSYQMPKLCKQCKKDSLIKVGIGTQQVEKFLKEYFKKSSVNIFRFDADQVKNKTQKENALEQLNNAEIIIGTKMITTGFDFENVGLIAVILLEQELLIPGYNTQEKLYANIKQLIGRGGRKGEITETIIQTFIPENEIVKSITEKNYKLFFIDSLKERKMFHYPPYAEMVTLEYRHKIEEKAHIFINKLQKKIETFPEYTLYDIMVSPRSFKKNNQYFFKIIIKGQNTRSFLKNIKSDIMSNSALSVIFES
ncbi:MAG: primosomal protein N' [Candidatus Gracilibacteria bacterium]|nr:primosomal protein N' [Candidatus Gracilibacteria bacterium]